MTLFTFQRITPTNFTATVIQMRQVVVISMALQLFMNKNNSWMDYKVVMATRCMAYLT